MPRTLNDIPLERAFPPPGEHPCTIIGVEKRLSEKKRTPSVHLVFSTGETEFDDDLFVTEKTLPRLCLVAKRICNMLPETELPDNDLDAARVVANYILDNAKMKPALVTIVEFEESYIAESGPDMGRTITKKRRKVAYSGYKTIERQPGDDNQSIQIKESTITNQEPSSFEDQPLPF